MSAFREVWQLHPILWTGLIAAAALVAIAVFLVTISDLVDYLRSLP